ncbi:protein neprosin-like [Aristolochia californica]|uniref:protein neprosin-like n=1 Tax=Aristolochia californica TaxID=171875 RepID=UPI0035DE21FE
MTTTPVLFLFLVSLVFSCEARTPSSDEYLEMKKYLQFINRPGVKTITMEPSFIQNNVKKDPTYIAMKLGFSNGGCPLGTVPLRKFQMEDLLRAGSVSNFTKKLQKIDQDDKLSQQDVHAYAAERLMGGPFYGTAVTLSVWNPQPNPQTGGIFSLAQLWVTSLPYTPVNTIEVGWQVSPTLYGNYATHLFIFWTNNGYQTGCYNLRCPGFVQVSSVIVPEMILPVSVPGGPIVEIILTVVRDANTGNWWLIFNEASVGQVEVGYWPGSLYTYLAQSASTIDWGGEVDTMPGGTFPPMGSGNFPTAAPGYVAYARNIQFVDINGLFFDAPIELTKLETRPSCYQLRDGYNPGNLGRYFGFGGPGGNVCNALVTESTRAFSI